MNEICLNANEVLIVAAVAIGTALLTFAASVWFFAKFLRKKSMESEVIKSIKQEAANKINKMYAGQKRLEIVAPFEIFGIKVHIKPGMSAEEAVLRWEIRFNDMFLSLNH